MIRKRDLLDAVDELTFQVLRQGEEIRSLQRKVKTLENKKCTCPKECKKGPGRPRKCCEDELKKAIKAVTQPRDKSGKFAKKK